eukprot:7619058-Alexandrium_andersonii.AAC.1
MKAGGAHHVPVEATTARPISMSVAKPTRNWFRDKHELVTMRVVWGGCTSVLDVQGIPNGFPATPEG